VARDRLLPVKPPPWPAQTPRPFAPPIGEMRIFGEPAGRIPPVLTKPWRPMIMLSGRNARAGHAKESKNEPLRYHTQR
jgi:hypothetical protein